MEENNIPSGENVNAGSEDETLTDNQLASGSSEDKVAHKTYVKAVTQAKSRLEENKTLKAQLAEFERAKLNEQEKFKELSQTYRSELEQVKSQLAARVEAEAMAKKKSAVRNELLKLGLDPRHEGTAFRLMDISPVMIDEDNVVGAEEAAKEFKNSFADLGFFEKRIPGVDQSAPSAGKSGIEKLRGIKTQKEFDDYMKHKYDN